MRRVVITLLLAVSASLFAQEYGDAPRFPEMAYFRRHFAEPRPHVQLQAPSRLGDFLVDGRLELSLESYLELVLTNDTGIAIERLSIEPARNAIMRAYAPFDPFVTTSFQTTRSTTPSYSALEGADTLSQLRQPFHFGYQQMLDDGGQLTISFDGAKTSSNNTFATFNPALSASLNLSFAQPLLRNRGKRVNQLPILIARARYKASQADLEDRISRLMEAAEQTYWAAVEAREDVSVQQKALEVLDTSLKRYRRELELGELAPVDIYQPQQVYARHEILVTEARFVLEAAEDKIRQQIGADLDPGFRKIPIALTEALPVSPTEENLDREALVNAAMAKRFDLQAATRMLSVDDMVFEQARNALLPDVSLTATYSPSGRGGQFIERSNLFAEDGSVSEIVSTLPGGLGDALGQVFRFRYPTYSAGISLRIPIRDRRATADLADAAVNKRMDMLRIRALQQQVRLEVLNACSHVDSSRATIKLAQDSLDFARKRLDAEERKYERGVSTIFFLLDAQNALTEAEAELIKDCVQYRRNLAELDRVTGAAAEKHHIVIN